MASSLQELKRDMDQLKRRIASLERAVDSIASRDDIEVIEEAHEDLKQGKTVSLARAKKKV